MTREILEEILGCPSLPSLPMVALRVIELTADKDVSLKELASTIENDQALAAKVLRTVNSSFYAVRTPCATISKALVLLGLGPVKTLALGFSLVSSLAPNGDVRFNYKAYWRRALYTGVAAKCLAEAARLPCAEEAFLGGLLQDVGMVAMRRALGNKYLDVMDQVGDDHRKLVKAELAAFDLQHPDIGAMLAQRWKFPNELVLPVKYHERPTAAPKECADIVRVVGLGNYVHDALTDQEPAAALRRLYTRAEEWFGLTASTVDDTLRRIGTSVKEVSALFRLDAGEAADIEKVLRRAEGQLVDLSKNGPATTPAPGSGMETLLQGGSELDALTGALGRTGFDAALRQIFATAVKNGEPMALIEVSIDGFRVAVNAGGPQLGDDILVGITALLRKHVEPMGGVVCRLAGEIFGAIVPNVARQGAMAAAEEFRQDVLRVRDRWIEGIPPSPRPIPAVSASIGVACLESDGKTFTTPEQMVAAATRAVQGSRGAGGNGVATAARAAA